MPEKFIALIVDDELHNRNILEKMLEQHIPEIKKVLQAATVQQAIELINESHPSIIFLDIQMQGENGFDLLQQVNDYSFQIIFVTAHDNYAIKAFRFHAVDYLLKPVVVSELKEAVAKAIQNMHAPLTKNREDLHLLFRNGFMKNNLPENITIPTSEGFIVVSIPAIIYCQASNNYTIFHLTNNQKIVSSQTLGVYEELLADHQFFRAHRSYLVSLKQVRSYKKGEGGYIIMSNGDEIELSRNNKAGFLQLFKT